MTTPEEASKILNYIDFTGEQSVDFYEFVCAAASLHQNDAEAREFVFEIYADGKEMTEDSFGQLFGTVFRYLKSLDIIKEEYSPEIGSAKFRKYDYNKNDSISFD
jgi:Ca2+-binding EF-hand superfamily protein